MDMDVIQKRRTETAQIAADKSNPAGAKGKTKEKDNAAPKNGVINAGELNVPGIKDSTLKALLAQRSALKVRLDQFKKDSKIDNTEKEHEEKKASLQREADSGLSEVNRLEGLKDELQETYGVEEDSTEQKDLHLLEKLAKGKEELTEDEIDRVRNMGPLTEYQRAAFEYTLQEVEFQNRVDAATNDIYNENRTITAIKLERLKDDPMVDANKEAEELLNKVDAEIQKSLLEEIKNRVNENLDIDPNTSLLDNPQALIGQKKVTEEDLKGLAVDEKI